MNSFSLFGISASHSIVRKIGFFFLMLPLTMYVLIVVSFAIGYYLTAIPIIAAFLLCFLQHMGFPLCQRRRNRRSRNCGINR